MQEAVSEASKIEEVSYIITKHKSIPISFLVLLLSLFLCAGYNLFLLLLFFFLLLAFLFSLSLFLLLLQGTNFTILYSIRFVLYDNQFLD